MAPYAKLEVLLTLLIGAAVTALVAWWAGWWAVLPALLALALLGFYRDPPRTVPAGAADIVAAADGRIIEIKRDVAGPDGRPVIKIMTFLSVFNVHVNRSPCAGRVRDVQYRPGEFLSALRTEADAVNESNTLVLEPAAPLPGPIYVRQIAGILARRIVCAVRTGAELAKGERFGMIKLGSRTEVLLPEDPHWRLHVQVGQLVRGGLTVLATLGADAERGR